MAAPRPGCSANQVIRCPGSRQTPLKNPGRMMLTPAPAGICGTSAATQACQAVHVHRLRAGAVTAGRSTEPA